MSVSDQAIRTPVIDGTAKGQFGWVAYEFAAAPWFTLVTIFIFGPYVANVVAPDPTTGQSIWGYIQAVAGVLMAIGAPFLGAIADAAGRRKPWILWTSIAAILASSAMWFVLPDPGFIPLAFITVVIGLIAIEWAHVFHNAMLPTMAPVQQMGRLSGLSYGFGQFAGIIALGGMLALFVLPEVPAFGLDKDAHEPDRLAPVVASLWIVLFGWPLFLYSKDQPSTKASRWEAAKGGIATLIETIRSLRNYKNVAIFLLARMTYFDGLAAVFAFGGVFASGVFGWGIIELAIFGATITLVSGIGGLVGAWADPKIGSKNTIAIALFFAIIFVISIVSLDVDHIFFVIPVDPPIEGAAPFSAAGEVAALIFSCLFGFCVGPILASSRTMMAKLSPPDKVTEFFGLYSLAGKATSFMAPLALATVTAASGSRHLGFATVLVFIIGGFIVLLFVQEPDQSQQV